MLQMEIEYLIVGFLVIHKSISHKKIVQRSMRSSGALIQQRDGVTWKQKSSF